MKTKTIVTTVNSPNLLRQGLGFLFFIFLILGTVPAQADVNTGLVAWWPFNEGQGYQANDGSGNGNNIWIDSPSWAAGEFPESLVLDGSNQNLKTSTSVNLNSTSQVSVSIWLDHTFSSGSTTLLFSSGKEYSWRSQPNAFTFYLEDYSSGYGCGNQIRLGGNVNYCYAWPSNGWHHYVAIYNNYGGNTLYIDGVLQNPTSTNMQQPGTVAGLFENRPFYLMTYAWGQIDDVRVYNRALSSDDIQTLYNLGAAPPNIIDAPDVAVTAPSSGSTISGKTVTLTANVTDNTPITAVQFQLNGNNIGSQLTSSPYTFVWDSTTVTNGNYTLTAQAFNSSGQVTTASIPVAVTNTAVPAPSPTEMWPVVENVLDYGAKGDAVYMTADTVVSNTTITIDSNIDSNYSLSQADVGKVVELFSVGQQTGASTNMDLLTTIVSVTDAHHAVLATAPGLTATAVRCLIGTQNAGAFQAAVNAVSGSQTIIYIPAGRYLLIPPQMLSPGFTLSNEFDTIPAVTISKAGIEFLGESQSRTILLGNGACQLYGQYAGRGDMFWASGSFAGSGPLVFSNLTMDGGVPQGLRAYQYWPATTTTGDGWDVTHDALLDINAGPFPVQDFTNITLIHWRGEILKSVTSGTNSYIDIENSSFIDGNADSMNLSFTHTINHDLFDNVVQPEEFWLGTVCQSNGNWVGCEGNSIFENSTISNASSGFALTGADTRDDNPNMGSYTITNNTIDVVNLGIYFAPATRLTISNNRFLAGSDAIMTSGAGYQSISPYGDYNHEILIEQNYFANVNIPIALEGAYGDQVQNIDILHNMSQASGEFIDDTWGGGILNSLISNNYTDSRLMLSYESISPQWLYDDGSNDVAQLQQDNYNSAPTPIVYSYGRNHTIWNTNTNGTVFTADDSNPTYLPDGEVDYLNPGNPPVNATMNILNISNQSGPVSLYTSDNTSGLTPISVPNGNEVQLSWNGTAWQQSLGPEAPPTISLTSPTGSITVPGNITFSANANAGGSAVTKVDFYLNTNLIGTVTQAPYTLSSSHITPTSFLAADGVTTIQNVTPGQYLVTAKVTDNAGLTTFSSPVWISVSTTSYPLTVVTAGSGYGEVSGTNIDCGINNNECTSVSINAGTEVTLTATATNGSTFAGWSGGGCSGTGSCEVTMNSSQTVTATFTSGASPVNYGEVLSTDTSVTLQDAVAVAQYVVGLNPANFNAANAKVDGNSTITLNDAVLIAKYVVGLITKFPAQP